MRFFAERLNTARLGNFRQSVQHLGSPVGGNVLGHQCAGHAFGLLARLALTRHTISLQQHGVRKLYHALELLRLVGLVNDLFEQSKCARFDGLQLFRFEVVWR